MTLRLQTIYGTSTGVQMSEKITELANMFSMIGNHVVLRGFDDLANHVPLLRNSDDIDILVEDRDQIVKALGANIVNIGGERVKFDIRYVGDNYYDKEWQKNLLHSKEKDSFYNVPDSENLFYSVLYHCLIHKGFIHKKYDNLISSSIKQFGLRETSDPLMLYYYLLRYMVSKKYRFVRAKDTGVGFFTNKYKLNLFLIRKGGMQKETVSDILDRITKQGYDILDLFLTTVRDEKKMYSSLYNNFDQFEEEITKENSNQCVCVVTNSLPNVDISHFKNSIRKDYVDVFPNHGGLPGNLLHASDNSEDALRELEVLLDPSITSFRQLGTYYSERLT